MDKEKLLGINRGSISFKQAKPSIHSLYTDFSQPQTQTHPSINELIQSFEPAYYYT